MTEQPRHEPFCERDFNKSNLDHFARLISERGGDSVVFTDPDGYVEWANPAFKKLTGYTLDEMRGKKPGHLLQGPDTDPDTVSQIRLAIQNRETVRKEILNYGKNGDAYWIDIVIQPIFDDQDKLIHFMSIERDISLRRRMMDQMKATLEKEKLWRNERKLLSRASEWFYMAEDMPEFRAVVTRVMEAFFPEGNGALFIYSNSRDMLERNCTWGKGKTQPYLRPNECWALRRGRAYAFGASRLDFACAHAGEHEASYFCLPIIALGNTIGLLYLQPSLGIQPDTADAEIDDRQSESWELALIIAEQISLALAKVQVQGQLRDSSVKDALTGLWNRRWFDDALRREIESCRRLDVPMSVIYLDVDHFKRFNDENGHAAGDEALRMVGEALAKTASRQIYPCRIGGEEFAVLCSSQSGEDAGKIADELRASIASVSIVSGGAALPGITASAGVAELLPKEEPAEFVQRADEALYRAKTGGRNRTVHAPGALGLAPQAVGDNACQAAAGGDASARGRPGRPARSEA